MYHTHGMRVTSTYVLAGQGRHDVDDPSLKNPGWQESHTVAPLTTDVPGLHTTTLREKKARTQHSGKEERVIHISALKP